MTQAEVLNSINENISELKSHLEEQNKKLKILEDWISHEMQNKSDENDDIENYKNYRPVEEVVTEQLKSLSIPNFTKDFLISHTSLKLTKQHISTLWTGNEYAALLQLTQDYGEWCRQGWSDNSETNIWDTNFNCNDGEKVPAEIRLFHVLAFFNVDRIAKVIVAANETCDKLYPPENNPRLTMFKCSDKDLKNVKHELELDLIGIMEDLKKYGDACDENNYKMYQRGRITLECIDWWDSENEEYYPKMVLSYTVEQSESGHDW